MDKRKSMSFNNRQHPPRLVCSEHAIITTSKRNWTGDIGHFLCESLSRHRSWTECIVRGLFTSLRGFKDCHSSIAHCLHTTTCKCLMGAARIGRSLLTSQPVIIMDFQHCSRIENIEQSQLDLDFSHCPCPAKIVSGNIKRCLAHHLRPVY